MTTQELHIGIDLELQKLNSSVTQNIRSEEKDWFINKEVLKFIDRSMSGTLSPLKAGFQDTTRRIEDIKDLVRTRSRKITVSGNSAIINLPADCYRFVACDVTMSKDCAGAPSSTKVKEYRTQFTIPSLPTSLQTLKLAVTISGGEQTLVSGVDIPQGYFPALNFQKQKFMLIKALKILLPKKLDSLFGSKGYDLYYEKDRDTYIPDTFILYTYDQTFNSITSINGAAVTFSSTSSTVDSVDSTKYPIESNVRIMDDEFFSDAKHSYLSKSTSVSPMARIENNQILLEMPKGVVLGEAKIRYVCNPNLADVLLGSNINLGRVVLDKILTNTVAYIKALIQSDNYEAYKTENILTE